MTKQDYALTFKVERTPDEVFRAIIDVGSWWSGEVEGDAVRVGSEFSYRVPGMHFSRQRVTEFVPNEKVVWNVTEAELTFVEDREEWKDTDIVFEIVPHGANTEVNFTHQGLTGSLQCFKDCSNGWRLLINGNLKRRIETGKAQPSPW